MSEPERLTAEDLAAESATALPRKEVMSLLDLNADVDLALDLAAPVDLAVAANLNVAAPIEAAASANLLSANAEAVAVAQQHGTIDQGISGSAEATAPQNAEISQDANPEDNAGSAASGTDAAAPAPAAAGPAEGTAPAATGDTAGTVPAAAEGAGDAVAGQAGTVPAATDGAGAAVDDATDGVSGSVDSLLAGGSLLDANVDINANADVAAPINGAVAANANVAAPINASVAANIGSDGAVAQSLADQQVDINQQLDDVSAEATAEQNANVEQQ